MSNYAAALNATKEFYPFERWASYEDMEQYSEENCGAASAIVDRLIAQLIALGHDASKDAKTQI